MPWRKNVELIGYHRLNDRPGFKLAMQEAGGYFFLYVGSLWHSGWSILEVTDPAAPRYLRWLEGPPNTWTIQVQVAGSRMITALQHVPPSWSDGPAGQAPSSDGLFIWDVAQPDTPVLLWHWASGASGTHRNFFNSGCYVHAAATLPGYDGFVYGVVDIDQPDKPSLQVVWGYLGQHRDGGEEYTPEDRRRLRRGRPYPSAHHSSHSLSLHGGAYIDDGRVYCPWMRAGLVILDVSRPTALRHVSTLPFHPPLGSSVALHSAVPLPGRDLVVVNSEALRESCDEPVNIAGIVEVSDPGDPVLISLFPQRRPPGGYKAPAFCARGGWFGPHNQHQPQGMDCLWQETRYVFMTWFNAGLQIFDISEPKDPYVAGFYIPDDPLSRLGPLPETLVTQAEDVLVDRRGYIYMTEKNSGLYILGFDGARRA